MQTLSPLSYSFSPSPPKREKDPRKRVAITGMGVVSVFGNDVDIFYHKLLAGVSGVSRIDRFDATHFPTQIAAQIRGFTTHGYINPKEDRRLDTYLKYCIVAGKKALEMADLGEKKKLSKIKKERAGVVVGTVMGGYSASCKGIASLMEGGCKRVAPHVIPYTIPNMGSAILASEVGFMGPSYSISTACATSNSCFISAANHIRRGEVDLMLVGGVEAPILPIVIGGFGACRALSRRNEDPEGASRPWDKNRDGFVVGEGAGVLVMESLEHAKRRGAEIIGEYLGGAMRHEAFHVTRPREDDGLSVASCVESCLRDAGVAVEEVNYVNMNAASTCVGDLVEMEGMKKVFGRRSGVKMNATKSMIGHCLGAAGGLEAVATLKAIGTRWLHPSVNQFEVEEEFVGFDTVAVMKKEHEVDVALCNSFGFGGHNAVVAFCGFEN